MKSMCEAERVNKDLLFTKPGREGRKARLMASGEHNDVYVKIFGFWGVPPTDPNFLFSKVFKMLHCYFSNGVFAIK